MLSGLLNKYIKNMSNIFEDFLNINKDWSFIFKGTRQILLEKMIALDFDLPNTRDFPDYSIVLSISLNIKNNKVYFHANSWDSKSHSETKLKMSTEHLELATLEIKKAVKLLSDFDVVPYAESMSISSFDYTDVIRSKRINAMGDVELTRNPL